MTHHRRHRQRETPNAELDPQSAAGRYAAFRRRQREQRTVAHRFVDTLPFAVDDFQRRAIDALEANDNVLVAAPTGAGKTVIADFAVFLAQEHNVKAFYTTPIKALSNQKYQDLSAVYGADRVGLLTGDTSINPQADIVVMTTEVLRNMLYEHSQALQALRYVILDEVHYLADRFRGAVWEEVIIHLPAQVRVIGLSATVSNVEDFARWIESVRGKTTLVVSEHRPVPLEQHILVQQDEHTEPELLDVYRRDAQGMQTSAVNPTVESRLNQLERSAARRDMSVKRHGKHRSSGKREYTRRPQRYTPRRWAVVDELDYLDMLPGIYFVFSRNGCDQAVEQCMNAGLSLTNDEERDRIHDVVDDMVRTQLVEGQLDRDDLRALGFHRFRYALEEGFAAHHAGMIALFRHIVERLFAMGLIKMVFATETLALGINMPARCVVVERLTKFDGTGHVDVTPGEYTQLTGRAGRRGIDVLGHAVVVDHPELVPQTVAALSSKRVYPLHSSFQATCNMAVNLLHASDYATARTTLEHSFAQWEANASAWQLQARIDTLQHAIDGYEQAFACEYGDMRSLMRIRMTLSDMEKQERRRLKHRMFASAKERSAALRDLDRRIGELRIAEREHPCHACPDCARHLTWGHRWAREMRESERLRQRYDSHTGSVARQFERICTMLHRLGYVQLEQVQGSEEPSYTLTRHGQLLRRLYSEHDVLLAHVLRSGALSGLNAEQLAAVLSGLVYEARRGQPSGTPRHWPGGERGAIAHTVAVIGDIEERIAIEREDAGLPMDTELDFGMVDVMYAWANGQDLASVLTGTELTGGDFVRYAKRLADVLQQIAVTQDWLDDPSLAETARQAQARVNRGVVAYSGLDQDVT